MGRDIFEQWACGIFMEISRVQKHLFLFCPEGRMREKKEGNKRFKTPADMQEQYQIYVV